MTRGARADAKSVCASLEACETNIELTQLRVGPIAGCDVERLSVRLELPTRSKEVVVVGERRWVRSLGEVFPSAPVPFIEMPLTFDRAFGGVDESAGPTAVESELHNLVGVGFHPRRPADAIEGLPVPNLEQPNRPIRSPRDRMIPVGFGVVGRNWRPRRSHAGEPIAGAMLERIEPHRPRRQRWLGLACYALFDLLGARMAEILAQVPMILVLSDREAATADGLERVRRELSAQLECERPPRLLQIVVGGPSAGLRALVNARAWLTESAPGCIVLAGDSLVDARSLHGLSQRRRLLTARNPDGLSPGEAAACVFLQSSIPRSWGRIVGLGVGWEDATFDNDVPLRAEGLVQASRAALGEAGMGLHDVDFRFL